ncbi:MAG: lipopolysaccharide biosynthesis protein [Flavobacterium sp.]|nr:lipopolysaccharide biosynthesis protein [Flavobacterium sp.]
MSVNAKRKKQIFWYNFANYTSYTIVVFSIAYLYNINIEIVGKIKYVESIATALLPFLSLGLSQTFLNFIPILNGYNAKNLYGISVALVFSISFVALQFITIFNFYFPISSFNFIVFGIVISSAMSFLELMKSLAITTNRISKLVLFEKIAPKIFMIFILLFFGKLTYDNNSFLTYYCIMYFVVVIYLLAYLNKFKVPKFLFKTEYLFIYFKKSDLLKYMFYSVLASSLSFLAFKLEGLIIPYFFSMKTNGLFSVALFISGFVTLPAGSVFALNAPLVSDMIKNNEFAELNQKYKEVAKLIFYKSFVIMTIIYCVLPQFFEYAYNNKADYLNLIPIIKILCLGSLISVATGFNNEIIIYSKFYKYNYLFTFLLVIINLGMFYYFLNYTNLGLVGVGCAISISIILFNLIKLIFIKIKFNLNPFDKKYLVLIILMSIVFLFASFCPTTNILFLDIFLKLGIIFGFNLLIVRNIKLIDRTKIV